NYLRASGEAEVESPLYVEALIAYYEKHYEDALKKAQEAFKKVSWLYEAKLLEGDVYLALGNEKRERGDYQGSVMEYDRCGESYNAAMEIAHSDVTVYEGECEKFLQLMNVDMARGGTPQTSFERVLSACDGALQADPKSGSAYRGKS